MVDAVVVAVSAVVVAGKEWLISRGPLAKGGDDRITSSQTSLVLSV